MNILKSIEEKIRQYQQSKKKGTILRSTVTALACVVCFVTVYFLVLPAITLEHQKAEDMPGIDVDVTDENEAFEEETSLFDDGDDESDLFGMIDEQEADEPDQKVTEEVFDSIDALGFENLVLDEDWEDFDIEFETEDWDSLFEEDEPAEETQPETELQIEEESLIEAEPQAEVESQTEPQAESETEEAESQTVLTVETEDEENTEQTAEPVQAELYTESETEPQTESETGLQTETVVETEPEIIEDVKDEEIVFSETDVLAGLGALTQEIEELPETIPETIAEETTDIISEEVTEETTERITEEITEEATESISEGITEEATESVSEEITESSTESISEEMTEEALESVYEEYREEETEEETESITEGAVEEITYPEQQFAGSTDYVTVNISAPEGAFPDGTTMSVVDIEDEDTLRAVTDAAVVPEEKISQIHAVDITFRNEEGEKVEPLLPIHVEMIENETHENEKAQVIHVDDEGNTDPVEDIERTIQEKESEEPDNILDMFNALVSGETETEPENEEVIRFEAEDFSVYALVYTIITYTNVISDGGETYQITVTYDETSGIPEEAQLFVREITPEDSQYQTYYDDAVEAVQAVEPVELQSEDTEQDDQIDQAERRIAAKYARFFDIEIRQGEKKIEPTGNVTVGIQLLDAPEKKEALPNIVHFAETGVEVMELNDSEKETDHANLKFETDHFSVYSVIYTVDFYWEVNGKTYEFGIPGGGFVSLEHLVEALGIGISETNNHNAPEEAQNVVEEEISTEEIQASEAGSASPAACDEAINLNEAEVSEETKLFVEDVEKVEFSNPELVWVGKIDETATVGGLKEANSLEVEYSADLTEEQITKINAQTVEAGDWALISVHPFTSEETLTVTMKNGDVFTIRVTDYQISTNVLTADGKNYKITVIFDDDAEIPAGTKLVAEEIEPGTDEYLQHLGKAWAEVNKEYLEQAEEKQNNNGGLDEYEDIRPVNLDDARFFSISLIYNEEEIEPKAPAQVDIQYVDGLETNVSAEEVVLGAAHFIDDTVNDNTDNKGAADGEVELIQAVDTVCDEDGKYVEFTYEQDSFSDIGTYVGQKTYDNVPFVMNAKLAMPLFNALSNTREIPQLADIEAHKSLNDNHDGTYTMSLTVKGDSKAYEEYTKANILFVMDRSSSMTSNCVDYIPYNGPYDSSITYYGTNDGTNFFALNHVIYYGTHIGFSYSVGYSTYPYNGTVYTGVTRLAAEQAAMDVLIQNLLGKNDPDTPGKEDLIEISVISFADDRQSGNTEYTDWTSTDYEGLMGAVNNTNTPSGTNWEDALVYAKEQADARKLQQPDEDVYIIFLTDGEPTAVYGESGNAYHYISSSWPYDTLEGGFEYALTEVGGPYNSHGRENDGKNALDRAKEIVDGQHKFYGIFTFNPGEAQTKYLRRLMNFAYTGVDKAYENDATKEDTEIVKKYFTNADTPENLATAFEKIFADISNTIGHGNVVITDGLQAADAMTTTIHADRADGFRYSVTDETGNELYYVTATGSDTNPTVTFHIDGQPYTASKEGEDENPYYSVTVNGTVYKMALADLSGRELTWNLSAIGTLLPGCTYKVDIIVWPNQAAYDYVAGLNNGLPNYTWNSAVESNPDNYHEVTVDGKTYGYYTGGVPGHDSIVKYADTGVYSVLTNTHQELNYSIVKTHTNEVTGETTTESVSQPEVPLEPQKPMDLVDTRYGLEKQWNVALDPDILDQLLYPADGSHYTVDFGVYQDTNTTPYQTITLGWNGEDYEWVKNFNIPTGLMLSEGRMDALGMDKTAYPSGSYPVDPDDPESEVKTYYLLENGHDYVIKEQNLSYQFDFHSDVFHPMLVDGKMQSVNFTRSGNSISISNMTSAPDGLSTLKVENTLRGYIHLEKHVIDEAGRPIPADKTKFKYTLLLNNADSVFEGTHIPWYGINGLYYHDRAFNYYQVYYENNQMMLKNESGDIYPVTRPYNLDDAAEQMLYYRDGEEEKSLPISGNQTTPSDEKKTTTAILQISQGEVLSIANVPAGTEYNIVETEKAGYELVSIDTHFDPNDVEEDPEATTINLSAGSIHGTIVPYHHNYIEYTNRCFVMDITIQKIDESGEGLNGAVFQLKTVSDEGLGEALADTIDTVSGIGDVTKVVNGESITFPSSFESTGDIQTLSGLPDGTYRLYEVYVPDGYITTFRYIQFTIDDREMKDVTTDTGDTSKLNTTTNNINLKITNEPGAALPHTGGPGPMKIWLMGIMFTGLAGIGLMLRRRRNIA